VNPDNLVNPVQNSHVGEPEKIADLPEDEQHMPENEPENSASLHQTLQSPIPDPKFHRANPLYATAPILYCAGNVEAGESRWTGNACGGRNFVRASAEESRFHR